MKKTIVALSLAALALPALAQDKKGPEPDFTVSGNFGLTSDYRFRGISQSDKKPAIQGGIDFAHKSGFYLGNWNSSVSEWASPYGSGTEVDAYGGFKFELASIGFDLGVISYNYFGSQVSTTNSTNTVDTREVYIGLGYGPGSFKISRTVSDYYFGIGKDPGTNSNLLKSTSSTAKGTMYYDISFAKEVVSKLTVKAHAGALNLANKASGVGTIKDYSLGLAYDIDGWILGVTYYSMSGLKQGFKDYATTASTTLPASEKLYDSGAAISLTKSF